MNAGSVFESLSSLTVGTVAAWLIAIAAIITTICTGTIKLYKVFSKYRQLKDEDERQRNILLEHDTILKEIKASVKQINDSMDKQSDVDLKVIRYLLVNSCEDALAARYVSESKLKILEEMFEEYTSVFHGNGYVKVLMERVRQLI